MYEKDDDPLVIYEDELFTMQVLVLLNSVSRRLDEFKASMDAGFDKLEASMDAWFDKIDRRFDSLEWTFTTSVALKTEWSYQGKNGHDHAAS